MTEEEISSYEDFISMRRASLDDIEGRPPCFFTKYLQREKQRIECQKGGETYYRGIKTGFYELDEVLGGLQGGRLTILAARTGVGKTTLLLNIASNISIRNKVHIAFVSTEMSADSLIERVLADQLDIRSQIIQTASAKESEKQRIVDFCKDATTRFHINDDSGISIQTLCDKVERYKKLHQIKVVFVDYIQRVGSEKTRQRYEEIGDVTRQLQAMAKNLDVHVLCAAQLSRSVDNRAKTRANPLASSEPQLSDLRESGNIEQDADAVLLLSENREEHGKTHKINIAKNRHGGTGIIMLRHNGEYARFTDRHNRWRGNEKGE